MSTSLRDQLIQAGLVTEKQARLATQHARPPQQPKRRSAPVSEQQLALQRAQAAKSARDQALNAKQRAKAERAARLAQIRELVEQHRLARIESEDYYNFTDGGRIKRIAVDAAVRARLQSGELSIVRCAARYEILPAAAALRVGERDASAVMAIPPASPVPDASGEYSAFVVPDDLVW